MTDPTSIFQRIYDAEQNIKLEWLEWKLAKLLEERK